MLDKKQYLVEKIKTANPASVLVIVLCWVFLFSLLFVEVPQNNKDIVNFLAGSFFGYALGGSVKYLFDYIKKEDEEIKSGTK